MAISPYTVRLHLSRSMDDSVREARFDVVLEDGERASTAARAGVGLAFLDLRRQTIPGLDSLTVSELVTSFLRNVEVTQEDGLLFGRHLLDRLLADLDVRVLWDEIQARRTAEKRPLRLELLLPADDAGVVSDIPFELLADESGFLFRQVDATLVRAIRRLPVRVVEIAPGDGVMLVWANPKGDNRLPQTLFDQHEQGTREAAVKAGLVFRAPCSHATRSTLEARLVEKGNTPIVSLVAHGDQGGGAVWLHRDGHAAYPDDPGDPLEARDLAASFKRGGVRIALLWTCHSGKHNAVSGALATTLLDPAHGDLAAVVASHAALRAGSTAALAARLFASLRASADGDFERAVSEARHALPETDLQWAAPVYYARPSGGRSVTLADGVEEVVESLRASEAPQSGEVEHAPGRWPHFRGRSDEIARGLAYLRTGRLVSITGMAGMGKTEVALEIAREAAKDAGLDLGRVTWLGLDGVRQAEGLRASLAFAFGAEPKECPDDAALARWIGGARALVVLDNAEDPVRGDRGAVMALLDRLLRECSSLKVLLATRERLGGVRAETEHEVRIGKLAESDARAVFLSVAGERLDAEEQGSAALGEMLTWLDGHALSLVLVAKQVGTMALPALLRRLERQGAEAVQIDELFGEEVGADQDERLRKERLVSSLNLSYLPLAEKTPGAAEMFAWLGHFPAGLPGLLVPLVFGEEGEERRAILLRKGLAEEVGRERRLVLPAPVRAYARAKAGQLLAERTRELVVKSLEALGNWLAMLLSRIETRAAREALGIVAQELPNLDALMRFVDAASFQVGSADQAKDLTAKIGHAALLLGQTVDYNGQAEHLNEILVRARCVVERMVGAGQALANVLTAIGEVSFFAARVDAAEETYVKALAMYRDAGDVHGEATLLVALGEIHLRNRRLGQAEESFRESIRTFDTIDAKLEAANARGALGRLCLMKDQPAEAETLFQQVMIAYQNVGSRMGEANIHKLMGDIYARSGRPKEAELSYHRALPLCREVGHRLQEANLLRALGELYFHTAKLVAAEDSYNKALDLYDALAEPIGWANVKLLIGVVLEHRGRLVEAEQSMRAAIEMQHKSGDKLGLGNSYKTLGNLYAHAERLAEAEFAYGEALRVAHEFGDRLSVANASAAMGGLYADTERLDEAKIAYATSLTIYQSIRDKLGEANCLSGSSNLALRCGELVRSYELSLAAMIIYRTIGETWGVASAHAGMAHAIYLTGDMLHAAALMAHGIRLRAEDSNVRDELLTLVLLAPIFEAVGMRMAADAAELLAFSHATSISINHPYAVQLREHLRRAPPLAPEVAHLQTIVKAALTSCETSFAQRGRDLYGVPSRR